MALSLNLWLIFLSNLEVLGNSSLSFEFESMSGVRVDFTETPLKAGKCPLVLTFWIVENERLFSFKEDKLLSLLRRKEDILISSKFIGDYLLEIENLLGSRLLMSIFESCFYNL